MKLIIEIDEESYKEIKKIVADGNDMFFTDKLIANGIPLDSVKAKIEKSYNSLDKYYPFALCTFKNIVREILDNIGKAEK